MPKRSDLKTILVLGAGPIVIGQACEFDYSGVQACKALREEGFRVVLVNSNPATIMTDPDAAEATYIEPIRWQSVARIIEVERPDAILPTMGGQTALNCSLDLVRHGVLDAFDVEMIGATAAAIDKAEDRELFGNAMRSIGLETVRGDLAHSLQEAQSIADQLGFPVIVRPSFTLGGSGGGIAGTPDELTEICQRGLDASPTGELLIEECILGWKEYELEVVRDRNDNCIIVCSIENLDPVGIHTGDSITVAPAQTLTDKEFQTMRDASIAVLREIGVDTGGSNVQFGVNPIDGRQVIIEMNPRVSRSSALASKATGFPIAKVAAKLAVGFTLDELGNDITGGATPASFEPSIDYVVTKIPRFDFEKFPSADASLTTQMKSVGEVMAIGRTFMESFHKALRSMEIGKVGLDSETQTDVTIDHSALKKSLQIPGARRIWCVADALRWGISIDEIHQLSGIDPWFLSQISRLVETEAQISKTNFTEVTANLVRAWKRQGFSDARLAVLLKQEENAVRKMRQGWDVRPVYKRVDSCAGEFVTPSGYLYSSYEDECEAEPDDRSKIMILGGGPNRIGQGIEFDYCCVHAAMALREDGFETIMVNCNPETVSTDYDSADRLYFEPVTLEDVLEIVAVEQPDGVIVQYGGQTPLKLAGALEAAGVRIIGTSAASIHRAEDREQFQALLRELGLRQPPNRIARDEVEAVVLAEEIGYPLIVRPSYVLGGRAMEVVHDENELTAYFRNSFRVSHESSVLLDRFLNDAIEVDIDALCDGSEVVIGGIMEHIEEAGIHSGDSACTLPPSSLAHEIQEELRRQTKILTLSLNVIGLVNIQFAVRDGEIYVLEVNPRAARTVPFVSKATARPLAKIAARCMVGQSLAQQGVVQEIVPPYFSVKEAVFPFAKFPGVDPVLGPEMKSTGEVMGVGETFGEAYYKAQLETGSDIPSAGHALISVRTKDQAEVVGIAQYLDSNGFSLAATEGTALALSAVGLAVRLVHKVNEGVPHVLDRIRNNEFDLIINTTASRPNSHKDSLSIRRLALMHNVTYFTTLAAARAACDAHGMLREEVTVNRLQSLHRRIDQTAGNVEVV